MTILNEDDIKRAFTQRDFSGVNEALDNNNLTLAAEMMQFASEEEASYFLSNCDESRRQFVKDQLTRDYEQACQSGDVESLKKVIQMATLFGTRDLLFKYIDEKMVRMAQNNQIEMMQTLLNFTYTYGSGPFNLLTGGTSQGVSVFQCAVNTGNMAMIQMILSTVKRTSDKNPNTSSSDSKLLNYLFDHTCGVEGNNVFFLAAKNGNLAIFNELLEQAPENIVKTLPKIPNANGRSVFLVAKAAARQNPDAADIMEKIRSLDSKLIDFQEKMDHELQEFGAIIHDLRTIRSDAKLDKDQQEQIGLLAQNLEYYRDIATKSSLEPVVDWPERMIKLKENCINAIQKTEAKFSKDKGVWNQWIRPLVNVLIGVINSLLRLCRIPENQRLGLFQNEGNLAKKRQFSELTKKIVDKTDDIERKANEYKEDDFSRKNSL